MEERFQFRHVHAITGTFVLAVVLILIAAVVWTGRSQRWFKSTVTLRIALPEAGAAGIRQGSEVYFLGTLVGAVADVIVDPAGRMEAEASIRRDFFRFVRADSSAVVKKKFGVAGDSFFEITRGEGRPLPEKNAAIICNEQFQSALESAIEEIRRETLLVLKKTGTGLDTWTQLGAALGETRQRVEEKATAGLDTWSRLGADLGETRRHLDQLTVRLESLAAGVEAGKGTAGKFITGAALGDEAQTLLTRANVALGEVRDVVTNLNVAAQNVRYGTARLPEITAAVANEVKDLPGLVEQTQASMRELERLIEAMQRHWLLRKYVNPTNPPSLRLLPAPPGAETRPGTSLRTPNWR